MSVGRGKFADCGIRGIGARLAGSGFRMEGLGFWAILRLRD